MGSVQVDMGYDISDYRDIHAPYGTLADVDRLIAEMHKRGMKLLLDLVVSLPIPFHLEKRRRFNGKRIIWGLKKVNKLTPPRSITHRPKPWFLESRISKSSPKRDWYI